MFSLQNNRDLIVCLLDVFGKPYCRVSMGKKEEMEMFLDSLKKVLV